MKSTSIFFPAKESMNGLLEFKDILFASIGYLLIYVLTNFMLFPKHWFQISLVYHVSFVFIFYTMLFYLSICMVFHFFKSLKHGAQCGEAFANRISHLMQPSMFYSAIVFLLCYVCWIMAQANLKATIPLHQPFVWDPALFRLDQWLGFGRLPWAWLHQWFGSVGLAYLCDRAYIVWFLLIPVVTMHQFFAKDVRLAKQYLWSFMLMWFLLGHVVATLFASVGPCFYHWLHVAPTGINDMMVTLASIDQLKPLESVFIQRMIIPYLDQMNIISAFPSMHVACVTLIACYARQQSQAWFVLATAFALLIAVASVYLGWHYFSDSLFAAIGTVAIWLGVGRFIRPAQAHGVHAAYQQR